MHIMLVSDILFVIEDEYFCLKMTLAFRMPILDTTSHADIIRTNTSLSPFLFANEFSHEKRRTIMYIKNLGNAGTSCTAAKSVNVPIAPDKNLAMREAANEYSRI